MFMALGISATYLIGKISKKVDFRKLLFNPQKGCMYNPGTGLVMENCFFKLGLRYKNMLGIFLEGGFKILRLKTFWYYNQFH